jgi:hypothetical protein
MNSSHLRARVRTRRPQIAAAGMAVLAGLALHAGTASASTRQATMMIDPIGLQQNPSAEVAQFRALGATEVRVMMQWSTIAPGAKSTKQPRFTATNPGAYPAANWNQWDATIRAITAAGMKVDLDVMGGPPRWAQGAGVPSSYNNGRYGWKVNAKDYGQFVQAVATRYDGKYKPKGSSTALPRVGIWSLWNEPNMGQQLGPQNVGATAKSNGYDVAAGYYRAMLRSAYGALRKEVKGSTILVGEFAGEGRSLPKTRKFPQGLPGNTAISSPVSYIATLYCLDSHNKPLSGIAAKDASCPTSAAARRSFVKNNPALFDASAISMHPYASTFAPNAPAKRIPASYIILPVIGRLTHEMSAVTRAWHHTRNYPVWSTEYGYITSPPAKRTSGAVFPSPVEAAVFLNEAEYLSYRNSRVATYSQYLLADPIAGSQFASGLLYANGKPKPGYAAFRLPLWMPHQTVKKGSSAEIWGGARPAVAAAKLGGTARQLSIQMQSGGSWKTIHTVNVNAATGYFDIHLKLSSGGSMRLAYTYPSNELGLPVGDAGTTVYSRTLKVTLK